MALHDSIMRLRRMIAEPTEATYTDDELGNLLQAESLPDRLGNQPDEEDWEETYDENMVASRIWLEKSSNYVEEFDFTADGGSFSRSQKYEHCLKQSSYYASRSAARSKAFKSYPKDITVTDGYDDIEYKDWIDDYNANLV